VGDRRLGTCPLFFHRVSLVRHPDRYNWMAFFIFYNIYLEYRGLCMLQL
jgi:hypothetical protein